MTDLHRFITARALRDAQLGQTMNRLAAPPQPVRNDEPLRVFGANGLHEALNHPHIGFLRKIARLIEQVEAHLLIRDAPVAFGKVRPVESAGGQRLVIRPQVQRLLRRVHAIAGSPVQVEIDVDAVLAAEGDRVVQML